MGREEGEGRWRCELREMDGTNKRVSGALAEINMLEDECDMCLPEVATLCIAGV